MLEMKNVTFGYPKNKTKVLNNKSISFEKGKT